MFRIYCASFYLVICVSSAYLHELKGGNLIGWAKQHIIIGKYERNGKKKLSLVRLNCHMRARNKPGYK